MRSQSLRRLFGHTAEQAGPGTPRTGDKLSTDAIHRAVVKVLKFHCRVTRPAILDIGAGTGALITQLEQQFKPFSVHACDYTPDLMEAPGQTVEIVDLNRDGLPYGDGKFDVVTCTEVVEHLENFRSSLREIHRVLKPGGVAVFSTPNILNLRSRTRFFFFGFWNLFGPLKVGREEAFSTLGHINPVSFFYLAHALAEAGFKVETPIIDRVQRGAIPLFALCWPVLRVFELYATRRERQRYRTIDATNEPFVAAMNRPAMLLGRTIVVAARKH